MVKLPNGSSLIQLNPNQRAPSAIPAVVYLLHGHKVNTYWRVSKSIPGLSWENISSGTFCAWQKPDRKLLSEVFGNTWFGYFCFSCWTQKTAPLMFQAWWQQADSHIIYQTLSDTYIITSVVVFLCQKMSDWGHIVFLPSFLLHICVQLCGTADQTFPHFLGGGGVTAVAN